MHVPSDREIQARAIDCHASWLRGGAKDPFQHFVLAIRCGIAMASGDPQPMGGLTKRQADALRFIVEYSRRHGFSPSLDEIGAALGLASKSGSSRLIEGLVARGAIRKMSRRARSIEVLALPLEPHL